MVDDGAPTAAVLREVLGFRSAGEDGPLSRFHATEAVGGLVDIRVAKGFLPGRQGRGSVHHIAFRAPDDTTQAAMAQKLVNDLGLHPTQQLDRQYFRSVYFREPGGILFEIATDVSGLRGGRAGRDTRSRFEAAAFPRATAQRDRSRATRTHHCRKLSLMNAPLSFIHRFEKGADAAARPLLLLHGTGGDENDLVPLGRMIAPAAPLLSVRGKVLENGMPRFFRRFAEGKFDEDDVRLRAGELADFVVEACKHYGIAAPIALGYSNGANTAAAILLLRPGVLAGAILLRATLPLSQPAQIDLNGVPVLINSVRTIR